MRLIIFLKIWIASHWFELLIFSFSFILRLHAYTQSPFANGWDGYFYIIQIQSYIEQGVMHSSRHSLYYPLLILFHFFIDNYELTYQVVSASLVACFSLTVFHTSKALNPKSDMGYVVAALTLISPQLTFFGAQYAKNLMGVVCFLWLFIFLIKTQYFKVGLLFIINLFVHKLTAGLSIIITGLVIVLRKYKVQHLKILWLMLIISAVVVWVVLLLFGFDEFERKGFALNLIPSWPSSSFINEFSDVLTPLWYTEVVFLNFLFVGSLVFLIISKLYNYKWIALLVILFGLSFPFLEWSVLGISFRTLMVFLLVSNFLLNMISINLKPIASMIISGTIIFLSIYSIRSYSAKKYDPPYGIYKHISEEVIRLKLESELIIVHKAFAEYFTFYTGVDALPWLPEYNIEKAKLWRIGTGLSLKSIDYFSGNNYDSTLVYKLSPNYFLIREDLWQAIQLNLQKEDIELYNKLRSWKNPYEIRPSYLLKNKEAN